jgi:hypothetical protein
MLVEQRHASSDDATEAFVRRSDAALAAGNAADAESLARIAVGRDATYIPARLALGRSLEAQDLHAESAAVYADAARISPLGSGVRTSLRRVWIAPLAGLGIVYGIAVIVFRELGRRFDQHTVLAGLLILTLALVMWALALLVRRRRRFASLSAEDRRLLETQGSAGLFEGLTPGRMLFVGALIVLLSGATVMFAVGMKPSLSLKIGDCFSLDGRPMVEEVSAIPCDLPHGIEVFATVDDSAPAGAPYPGMDAVRAAATPGCQAAYERFVGVPYVRSSKWWINILSPAESYWVIGIRVNWCTLATVHGEQTMGSGRGSGN